MKNDNSPPHKDRGNFPKSQFGDIDNTIKSNQKHYHKYDKLITDEQFEDLKSICLQQVRVEIIAKILQAIDETVDDDLIEKLKFQSSYSQLGNCHKKELDGIIKDTIDRVRQYKKAWLAIQNITEYIQNEKS